MKETIDKLVASSSFEDRLLAVELSLKHEDGYGIGGLDNNDEWPKTTGNKCWVWRYREQWMYFYGGSFCTYRGHDNETKKELIKNNDTLELIFLG